MKIKIMDPTEGHIVKEFDQNQIAEAEALFTWKMNNPSGIPMVAFATMNGENVMIDTFTKEALQIVIFPQISGG